jgi:acyl-coenzyme A thioesterase 13
MSAIPEGFTKIKVMDPFKELVGPLYERDDDKGLVIGFQVEEKHKNSRGIVHGGMICTLADFAMGYAASRVGDPPRKLVTTTISLDFAGNAFPGDWVEARISESPKRIGRASATFLILPSEE